MARGDGKARRGNTRGTVPGAPPKTTNVKRMAPGGLASSTRDGGWAGAGTGSLSAAAQAQRSSVSPGAGNVSAGRTPGGNAGAGNRTSGVTSVAARSASLTNPAAQAARLGPNAAQAMVDAGVSPDTAIRAAISINRAEPLTILGDLSPGKRLATVNPDGTVSYSNVPTAEKAKQFYDRLLPDTPLPVRPISYTPSRFLGPQTPSPAGVSRPMPAPEYYTGPRATPPATPATPQRGPMEVYGDDFSFSPAEARASLLAMSEAGLPGTGLFDLLKLSKQLEDPKNKAMADVLAAPFSSSTRIPMGQAKYDVAPPVNDFRPSFPAGKGSPALPSPTRTPSYGAQTSRAEAGLSPKQITDRLTPDIGFGRQTSRVEPSFTPKQIDERLPQDPTYSSKPITDRFPGLTGPTEAPTYRTPQPTPKPRPSAPPVVTAGNKPTPSFGPGTIPGGIGNRDRDRPSWWNLAETDPFWAENQNKYRRRFGKPYEPTTGTAALKSGGRVRADGLAYRGKTKGRYI